MQLLRLIKDADKDIEKAKTSLEQAQVRLSEIAQSRDTALRETDGTALLDRLAALDAQRVRSQAVIDQLAQDLRAKQQSRQQMLPSFRTDRDVSVGATMKREKEEAFKEEQAGWAELEKAMAGPLAKIAQARARTQALEAQATFPAVQARLDSELLGISPPVPSVTPASAPTLPALSATTRPRHPQELLVSHATE